MLIIACLIRRKTVCTFVSNNNICECSIVFCVSECVQERKKVTGKKNYRDDIQEITFYFLRFLTMKRVCFI